ncbi:hypothetical protein [Bacillus sp. REN10]|uniref:hypothetical protein n=1 Tax=Bacillus sp. REN10 TaxID=2782541 RepID=UPI00193B9FAD|nr:hypothetical protein [Bacillus sp. REN10]
MRIALICPSNMLFMPYVENYIRVLQQHQVDYTVINWDRFQINDKQEIFVYRDKKKGHRRNYYDYVQFKKFIINKLEKNQFDRLIVFGLQISYFLHRYLIKNYKNNYIIDIRDHHKLMKFFHIKKFIHHSYFTVISSPAYCSWLPNSDKYVINHNTVIDNLKELQPIQKRFNKEQLNVSCIGAIRDYDINIEFIYSLKNHSNITLYYHGEGDINTNIENYLSRNNIQNVKLTGRYKKEDEKDLYMKSDLINVLRLNDGINNQTALPNRLYNAALNGRPMIALKGTSLTEEIQKYNLGLVVETLENVDQKIISYMERFDLAKYEAGRVDFFRKIIKDNAIFNSKLKGFIYSRDRQDHLQYM